MHKSNINSHFLNMEILVVMKVILSTCGMCASFFKIAVMPVNFKMMKFNGPWNLLNPAASIQMLMLNCKQEKSESERLIALVGNAVVPVKGAAGWFM